MITALDRRAWLWLGLIMAVGLGLRMAGAQGALWLDEAWSAKLAHDAGTPIGVFLNINHDNNHHLNSLWLQFVGPGAPPMLARALSIVTGTLAIGVAAGVAAPRGRVAMLLTAWLFAVSPILVTLGSEARGYAPMTLALLCGVRIVDRALTVGTPASRLGLALCFFLGTLSHLTIVFGVCALVGWYFLAIARRERFKAAIAATWRMFAAPLAWLGAAVALVFVPALLSPTGFQFGNYDPFKFLQFLHGLVEMTGYTVAAPVDSGWLIAGVLVLVVLARPAGVPRIDFYRLAIVGFPTVLALLHSGNVGHPRYYLVVGIAVLLLLGEMLAVAWSAGGWRRAVGAAGFVALSIPSLVLDVDLAVNRRGDGGAAVRTMRARAPAGATIILDRETSSALIEQSSAYERYPVTIQETPCPAQRFLLIDRFRGEPFPAQVARCGVRYAPIDGRTARGLSGLHWTLYERRP